jgi:hypothetical protein
MDYPMAGEKTSMDAGHDHTLLADGNTSEDGDPIHRHSWKKNGEYTSEDAGHRHMLYEKKDDDDGMYGEMMGCMSENLTAMREMLGKQTGGPPPVQSEETRTLLTMIAKNTMRKQRAWEFDIQRDRRTGFTEKIIAKPVGE